MSAFYFTSNSCAQQITTKRYPTKLAVLDVKGTVRLIRIANGQNRIVPPFSHGRYCLLAVTSWRFYCSFSVCPSNPRCAGGHRWQRYWLDMRTKSLSSNNNLEKRGRGRKNGKRPQARKPSISFRNELLAPRTVGWWQLYPEGRRGPNLTLVIYVLKNRNN